mmetsp:Transcript_36498/g.85775  ORF Transcript_36498/g.85775 Transcript_36498/m.85775 type:complete len:170 (+) Transcript_36498:73-582(+)
MVDKQTVQNKIPDIFWTVISMGCGLLFMHFGNKIIVQQGYAALVPPHAASLVIAVSGNNDPYKMGAGYLVSGAAAYGILQAVGDNFLPDFGGSRALMVACACAGMKVLDCVHPPAAAYAMSLADVAPMRSLGPKFIAYPGFLGVCLVYVAAFIAINVRSVLTEGKLKTA